MGHRANLVMLASTTVFVTSGIIFSFVRQLDPVPANAGLSPNQMLMARGAELVVLDGRPLPLLFLSPGNLVMWSLLAALWIALAMDAAGQWIDPSDPPLLSGGLSADGQHPVWPMLAVVLILAGCWPWLLGPLPWAAVLFALASAALAFLAALRAEGQRRPAVGFLAGWCLGVAMATLAERVGAPFSMSLAQTSILAILPAAGFGMAGQLLLGRAIGFSVALIWAFCGLAITAMVSSPMAAIAAILGIALMATVLIRAAS